MNTSSSRRRECRVAVLCAAVLLSACQSQVVATNPNSGTQTGLTESQRLVPCDGVRSGPMVEGTPLPTYVARSRNAGTFTPGFGIWYVYIADEYNSTIDIFPFKGRMQSQVGTITAGIELPYGIWFDRGTQSLYVANQSNSTVTVYPYGSTQPSLTYSDDLSRPLFPIVDRHGDLFVSNANTGAVVEFLAGSTTVHAVLQTPGVEADGMAFDRHGNLYVAYRTCPSGDGSVEKFAPGSSEGTVLGMSLSDPQGIVVDGHGNIVVDETGTLNDRIEQIEVFPPGSTTASLVIPMAGGNLPIELSLGRDEKYLFIAGLYSGAAYGTKYPLGSQSLLFVKDQVSAVVQGVTITNTKTY
jgi:DNA-binding beta-propeller fold protein YncE